MKCVVSVDAGGTTTRVLLQSVATGREICRSDIPTRSDNYVAAFGEIIDTIYTLAEKYTATLVGVGVGVAGVVESGIITGAGNLPAWVGHNLESDLAVRLNVPVVVMNDAAAAALGEYTKFGRPLFYVVWGTGIGGAVVLEHGGEAIVRPTEFGHITIDQDSASQCGCGGVGHLEALASGGKLADLFDGCKANDLSDGQWSSVLRPMAVGVRSLSALWLDLPVVFGGGVSIKQLDQKRGRGRLPELQKLVDELPSTCPVPKLYVARHGEDSGLMGAAAAARRLVVT